MWENVSLPINTEQSEVSDIEQLSDGCLYATTIQPVSGPDYGNVCKSCDGGATWSCMSLEIPGVRHSIKVSRIHEGSDGTIYAASYDTSSTSNNSGVWKSTDSGTTWSLMHALIGTGCTSVVEAADGSLIATTKGYGSVWRCADPIGNPTVWAEVFQTPSIAYGGSPTTYPPYPPPVLPACEYLRINYPGEDCNVPPPYDSYPDPYRPDRTQSLYKTSSGTLFMSINSGTGSVWSEGQAVRNFGHIYMSTNNGVTWQDSGSWNPPPTSAMEYWGYWNGSSWVQHHHLNGTPAADVVPTMQSFPTWVDHIWQDHNGVIYAVTSSGDPLRSWILNPRRDGIVFVYDPVDKVWDATGNLLGTGNPPGTDTYSQNNAVYSHDIDEDASSGNLYVVSSVQAQVNRSTDGGASWSWHMSPRTLFGKAADGDFYSMEITCNSCLYVGYQAYGEIYASRSQYYGDGYIQDISGFSYSGDLTSFTETTTSDSFGTITYWISNGGGTWYWWNGSGWAATTDPAESNPASVVNANIGSFFISGTFHFRAFLHPATVQGCPKSPHLVSLEVCEGEVTPTPTPVVPTATPTPTGTPPIIVTPTPMPTPTRPSGTVTPLFVSTPTPTPCFCERLQLELSEETASPGMVVDFYACVPPTKGEVVDAYLLGRTPHGVIYSILFNGKYQEGITPYYRGYINDESFCGPIHKHLVCEDSEPGEYLMGLLLTPAGSRLTRDNILDMDIKVFWKTQ